MTDPIQVSFSLNQAALNTAIAAALPSLLKDLEFDYVSGRPPKGLQASVIVNEAMIREAVERYARRTVAATFTHFSVEFKATRGEDGIVADVTASNEPIKPEEDKASAPVAARPTPTSPVVYDPEPATEAPAEADEDAPFEDGTEETVSEEAWATVTTEAPATAPAPVRSKLFGDLKRPNNAEA